MNPLRRLRQLQPVPLQAWLLALMLLVAQATGLAHRISHAPQTGVVLFAATAVQAADDHGAACRSHGHSHEHQHEHAYGQAGTHEAGSADCRLIDQLAHADGLCVGDATVAALPAPQSAALALDTQTVPAGPFEHYLARAPPRA